MNDVKSPKLISIGAVQPDLFHWSVAISASILHCFRVITPLYSARDCL